MANFTNNYYGVISDKRSIPFNQAITGTIGTLGSSVVGVGTVFKTEMPVGSYLVDLANWELRRVSAVNSDTEATLEEPFTANISTGTTGQVIPADRANPVEISIEIKATNADGLLNNAPFSGILTYSKAATSRSSRNDSITPILVDASSTEMRVSILW